MVVRLAHVFGLGHFLGGAESGAITHTLLTCGRDGGVAKIARRQARPLERIYAKDVGRAVDLAATVPVPPVNVFNIGTGPGDHLRRTGGGGKRDLSGAGG